MVSTPRIIKNSIWNSFALTITIFFGFVTTPIILKLLGTSHYGLLMLLTGAMFPFGLATLNFGQATVKFISESLGRGKFNEAELFFRTTLLFNLLIGLLGALVLIFSSHWVISFFNISPSDRGISQEIFFWLAWSWFLLQVTAPFSAIPSAFQRYDWVGIGMIVSSFFLIIFSLLVLYQTRDLVCYVQARFIGQILGLIFWMYIARSLFPKIPFLPTWNKNAFRRLIKYGSWQTLGEAGGIAAMQADQYCLGVFFQTSFVGLYDVAMNVQKMAYSIGMKFSEVLFPVFSFQSVDSNRSKQLQTIMNSTWIFTILSTSIMVSVIVLGEDFLKLWVGNEVATGSGPILKILAFAGLIGSASNVGVYFLLGIGKTKWNAFISISTGCIVFIGSLLLVPRLGLAGAGWGSVAAMIVQTGFVTLIWFNLFGDIMKRKLFLFVQYGPMGTGIILSFILLWVRSIFSFPMNWVTLLMSGIFCFTLTGGTIFMVDRCLPGGKKRKDYLVQLIRQSNFSSIS